ncbi:hypothetical protein PWT90_07122 [Aphanocladium album]|nr:hypothetical protein PWT90_07122 [Aphanocladium album]
MKFGLNYDNHILANWSQHCIDYNGIRMQLRAKAQRGESAQGLLGEFCAEIGNFTATYMSVALELTTAGRALVGRYGGGRLSGEALVDTWAMQPVSFHDHHAAKRLIAEIKELQAVGKLNSIAIQRLVRKFSSSGQVTPDWAGQAESHLQACATSRQLSYAELAPIYDQLVGIGAGDSGTTRHATKDAPDSATRFSRAREQLTQLLNPKDADSFEQNLAAIRDEHLDPKFDTGLPHFFGRLLYLAAHCLDGEYIDVILSYHPDIGVKSIRGETALYRAAQAGSLRAVQSIATCYLKSGESLDVAVPRTGWTPLMVACAKGRTEIAEYLLRCGADAQKVDVVGWTAKEHAAYRGHLPAASLEGLASACTPPGALGPRVRSARKGTAKTLPDDQKAVIVTLGSVQGGHCRRTLRLHQEADGNDHISLDTAFLEISLPNAGYQSKTVPLPLLEDHSVGPLVGKIELDAQVQVTVRLWHDDQGPAGERSLHSSGTILLNQDYATFGSSRESMLRETTVILLNKNTMEYSGTVLLSYVVATPFKGLDDGDAASYIRQPGAGVRLVGHRGLGQNTLGTSNLQIGENTVTAWCAICRDVQLTRDHEAVIFHDFSFSGSGSDVPIHDISLAQYKYAGDIQNPSGALLLEAGRPRPRASSSGEDSVLKALQAQERLRHTVDYGGKGFKANIRGHSIQDAHATLEELLLTLPEEIGFNIEMKYQRLHEAVEAGVASVTIDINTFVDVALEKIRRLAGRRPIILSSFTPEVCILLKLKQSTYPVLFITNAGKVPMTDKELRAASLQMGMKFARYWQLTGLVLACDTFLLCPRLIFLVKSAGLVCASYGLGNNDPENAKKQADAGIDILIVDKVKLIAETLSKNDANVN